MAIRRIASYFGSSVMRACWLSLLGKLPMPRRKSGLGSAITSFGGLWIRMLADTGRFVCILVSDGSGRTVGLVMFAGQRRDGCLPRSREFGLSGNGVHQ